MSDELANMHDEVLEAVQRNLPAAIGTALKQRLQDAEDTSQKFIAQSAAYMALKQQYDKLAAELSQHVTITSARKSLDTRERDIEKRELAYETVMLRVKLEEVQKRNEDLLNLMRIAFRTPEKVSSFTETSSKQQAVFPPGSTYPVTVPVVDTMTRTITESTTNANNS
jgi:hypothetical protein